MAEPGRSEPIDMKNLFTQFRQKFHSTRFAWVTLFVIALIPKIIFIEFVEQPTPQKDAALYLQSAENIWNHGTFGREPNTPQAIIPVMYPLFLSPFVGLGGPAPVLALYVQAVLSALTCCIAFSISRDIAGTLSGWISGLFCASYVPMMKSPGYFLTETLTVFFVFVALYAGHRLLMSTNNKSKKIWAVATGVFFAISAMTRIVTFPLLLVPLVLVAFKERTHYRQLLSLACLMAGSFIVVYSPWVIRNYVQLGDPIVLTQLGKSIPARPYYNCKYISEGMSFWDADNKYKQKRLDPNYMNIEWSRFSLVYLQNSIIRFRMMLGVHPCLNLPFPFAGQPIYVPTPLRWFNYGWSLTMWIAITIAVCFSIIRKDTLLFYAGAIPFGLILLYSSVHVVPRYQIVSYGLFSVAAGVGLSSFYTYLTKEVFKNE